jgi:hypothetical protein
MKTKREVLKEFVMYGDCKQTKCEECPYSTNNNFDCKLQAGARLSQIGAMALLRLFREKKKPNLEVGTMIKFSNGEIATISKVDCGNMYSCFLDFSDGHREFSDYLIGRTWEVVE